MNMNAKEMAQAQETVRMGAIRRRIQKRPPHPVENKNKDVVQERKDEKY